MPYMPWLYDDLNKQQAVRLLKENHEGDGSFLVRTNLIRENEFVLYVYKRLLKFFFYFVLYPII